MSRLRRRRRPRVFPLYAAQRRSLFVVLAQHPQPRQHTGPKGVCVSLSPLHAHHTHIRRPTRLSSLRTSPSPLVPVSPTTPSPLPLVSLTILCARSSSVASFLQECETRLQWLIFPKNQKQKRQYSMIHDHYAVSTRAARVMQRYVYSPVHRESINLACLNEITETVCVCVCVRRCPLRRHP